MRQFRNTAVSAALLASLAVLPVHAASLGRLQVLSAAGQPLLAEIELDGLTPEDFASLKVGIADPAAFKAAQLEPSPLLSRLRFEIVRGLTPDRATVRITSAEPIGARYLDTLIELSWASGRAQREYTLAAARPSDAAGSAPPESPIAGGATQAVQSDAPPVGPSQTDPAATGKTALAADKTTDSASGRVGKDSNSAAAARVANAGSRTVRKGESLAQIAKEVAPDPKALNASMAAIFEANRNAFIGNSIHLLREGAVISIPEEGELKKRSDKAALQMLAQFDDRADPYFQRLAATPAVVKPTQKADTSATGDIGRVEAEKPAPKTEDQLKVSRSRKDDKSSEAAANAQAEELLRKEKALTEANERIALLEKNIADMQRLLALKNAAGSAESAPVGGGAATDSKPADAKPVDPKSGEPVADAAKAGDGTDKPAVPADTELKPETPADADKAAKADAELADEHDSENAKKKPWYQNGLVLAGAGGAIVLGGGVAGFLFMRRRRQAAADEPVAAPVADLLADPAADLLNADVGEEPAADATAADSDLPGLDAETPSGEGDLGALAEDEAPQAEGMLADEGAPDVADAADAGALASGAGLDDIGAESAGAGLLAADDESTSGEAAELAAAAVDLDFETAASASDNAAAESLLPPDMQAGDPPRPGGTEGTGSFADELDALSSQVGDAQASLDALREEAADVGSAEQGGAGDDDFGALQDDAQTESAADDPSSRRTAQRLSDTLASIDLDLPGAGDELPADPLAGLQDDTAESADEGSSAADTGASGKPTDKDDLARWQEIETKLDLAAAYIEIGDNESAQELLGEVMKKGDATQTARAGDLLTRTV